MAKWRIVDGNLVDVDFDGTRIVNGRLLKGAGGDTGQSITLNQITNSTIAQALTVSTAISISITAVTNQTIVNSLTPVPGPVTIPINQIAETTITQSLTPVPGPAVIPINQIVDTTVAQTLTPVAGAVSVAINQITNTDIAQTLSVGGMTGINQIVTSDLPQTLNPIPAAGKFHELFTDNYADLPSNSFAKDEGLSEIVIGDGYEMDLTTTPEGASVSGDDKGVITVGTITVQNTIEYKIYDASTGNLGAADNITVDPPLSNINQIVNTTVPQSLTPIQPITATINQITHTTIANSLGLIQNQTIAINQVVLTDIPQTLSIGIATSVTVENITGGANLTSLSYVVFSAADIGDAGTTIIKRGNDETTDSNGNLVIDLTGLNVALGKTLTIVITNYTTDPALTDRGAVCFADAA